MSSLLEQAIIDATALKEAALKNAEAQVLERYSTEVKDAIKRPASGSSREPLTDLATSLPTHFLHGHEMTTLG